MESLDQEFASRPAPNGHQPVNPLSGHVCDPPDNHFGPGDSDCFRWEWGNWIFTAMRESELKGEKPKPFSAWVGLCVMAHR